MKSRAYLVVLISASIHICCTPTLICITITNILSQNLAVMFLKKLLSLVWYKLNIYILYASQFISNYNKECLCTCLVGTITMIFLYCSIENYDTWLMSFCVLHLECCYYTRSLLGERCACMLCLNGFDFVFDKTGGYVNLMPLQLRLCWWNFFGLDTVAL